MKQLILAALVLVSANVKAQTLKELLYSGKLKKDSSGVIRRTDDLSTKIDTSTKKEPEVVAVPVPATTATTTVTAAQATGDSTATAVDPAVVTEPATPAVSTSAVLKNNTRLWKEYTDSLQMAMKAEVLPNKKIKKGTYYLIADYDVDTEGNVTITNLTASPDNAFLAATVKQWMETYPPKLNPITDSNNKAKKVKRKLNFTLTKD